MRQKPILDLATEHLESLPVGPDDRYYLATHQLVGKQRRVLLRIMDRTRRKGAELDHDEARHAVRDLEVALVPRLGHRRWQRFVTDCVELASAKHELEARKRSA